MNCNIVIINQNNDILWQQFVKSLFVFNLNEAG